MPVTPGRARPIMRLTMVTNRLGAPIATNRNPTRTITAASTRCDMRDRLCGSAASARNKMPSGQRNQPDLPKSVIQSKNRHHPARQMPTALIAAASTKIMPIRNTATATAAAIASF